MDINHFIQNFKTVFEDSDHQFVAGSLFKELPDWNSMHALHLVGMIDSEYGVEFTYTDLKGCKTVEDVYLIVKSRIA